MLAQGDYRLGEEIGSGAVATVYRVVRADDGQRFAGKLPHPSQRRDPAASERFHREAELCARLRHPNVVAVHGMIDIAGEPVLLMDLVEGPSLARLIAREAPLQAARVLAIVRGIAAGLAVAHEAGIVHRDLKPANILMAGSVPRIADFGMARTSSFAGVSGGAFTIVGTPDYMAPECLDPLAVDPRTDLYALGCILYELCTGQPPYGGATTFAVLEQHRHAPVPRLPDAPAGATPVYPPGLRQLCADLLAKSPADRPQAAAAVLEAIDAIDEQPSAPLRATDAKADAKADNRSDTKADAKIDRPDSGAPGQPARAVVPAGEKSPKSPVGPVGSCARCDAALLPEVPVCFGCGLPQARYAPGKWCVVVTGPGKLADQLDSGLRDRLLRWAQNSPGLGLDTSVLAKSIPRLPFALTVGLSEEAAQAVSAAVSPLGFQCQVLRGGPYRLQAMRRKMWVIGGRTLAIASTGMAGVWGQIHHAPLVFLAAAGTLATGAFTVGARRAARGVLRPVATAAVPMPALLRERIHAITQVVPTLAEDRHRQALRGVVQRTLSLRQSLPDKERTSLDEDLAQALDQSLVAVGRMDAIDARMGHMLRAGADLNQAGPEVRQLLLERDTWAGRLLDLSALLESLRVRLATVRTEHGEDRRVAALSDLRTRIAALEEIERL